MHKPNKAAKIDPFHFWRMRAQGSAELFCSLESKRGTYLVVQYSLGVRIKNSYCFPENTRNESTNRSVLSSCLARPPSPTD